MIWGIVLSIITARFFVGCAIVRSVSLQQDGMGNSESSSPDPRFTSASRSFTPNELEELRSLFVSLAAQAHSNGEFVSPSVFKAYFKIPGSLGERMFDLISRNRHDEKITFEDLVIAKGTYEKATKDEIDEFIYQLVDVNGDGILSRSDLEAVLGSILEDLFSPEDKPLFDVHQFIDALLNAVTFWKNDESQDEKGMSLEDFKKWCTLLPSVRRYLGGLLLPEDPGRMVYHVPKLVHEGSSNSSVVLSKGYAWVLGGAVSRKDLKEWKLLYNSLHNGQSFNTFFGNISNHQGPSLLIIKDKEGYIYGGYASQPWERHNDFFGDMKNFLFQLHPKASIYRPTGANSNLQWCAVNYSSEKIPNGIGFGGQVHHFGLFISASLDGGHTFSCTTYGSPSLSKSNQIHPEVIECWGIVPKGVQQERMDAAAGGTVLERFKEDRNMLNLVGLANSSE